MNAEQVGFWIGTLFGGFVVGALCGLLPLIIGLKKQRRGLALTSCISCVVSGLILGLILAVPVSIIFTVVILCLKKPEEQNPISRLAERNSSMAKRSTASIVLVIIFGVLAVVTLPGFFRYFYRAGAGHAFLEIVQSQNLPWDSMTAAQRAPYQAHGKAEGFKCAMLMTFGQHIPGYLFGFITIGLLTRSISHGFRVFLRFAFFAVWILGMLFLAFGTGYWGQALQFPESLGPAFLIYLVAVIFFGLILGIGKLIQRAIRKPAVQPPPLGETQE